MRALEAAGIASYFGVRVARRLEGEHLGIGTEFSLANDQSVQWRVEDVDAKWRDAVAGLGEGVSRQRGNRPERMPI
jgi:hypothetical protein